MDKVKEIYKILENVKDPKFKKSLMELEMVEEVKVENSIVKLKILLPDERYPQKNRIKDNILSALQRLEGIENVEINFTEMHADEKRKILEKENPLKVNHPFWGTNIIAVGSGKGGVGKSTVTANLAFALQREGNKVGIIDADIYGYSIPRLMGLEGGRVRGKDGRILPLEREGVKIISIGSFTDSEDKPIIWRAPMILGVLKQFMEEVDWGELDYLLIDLPPGTGDSPLNIMQMLPNTNLLIVTTPQASASHVAGRVGFLANEVDVHILGVIENMSYFQCSNCGEKYKIFGEGETEELAIRLNTSILGRIPLITEIREKSDEGNPTTLSGGAGEKIFQEVTDEIIKEVKNRNKLVHG
ncbi:MAG: Mrp/NBP35 family ATP-binding protein [Clostridia bacterium]|nr:Mrp/NBP35 family ATP-binding protein [Clostridia bacterium]